MDVNALKQSPIGHLTPITGTDPQSGEYFSYFAFIPKALPAELELKLATINMATKAAMAVARLDQAVSQLPNPDLLVRPIIRREAASTSALEGTYAAFNEILEADFLTDTQLSYEQREIRNYVNATYLAVSLLEKYPISRNMLGTIQKEIVQGTRDDSYEAGDLRKHQVAIGPPNRPITEARLIPSPPGPDLAEGFGDWEKWVNAENSFPIIIKAALAHYQFETLHPYNNGNGRLGRLVMVLQLMQETVLRAPVINISAWLEDRKDEYTDHLLKISYTGDFEPWISFFSEAVKVQADAAADIISSLLGLKEKMVRDLRNSGVRSAALELAEILIGYPVIDVPTAASKLGKSFETANQAVARLVSLGLLTEAKTKSRVRMFACAQVLRIVSPK